MTPAPPTHTSPFQAVFWGLEVYKEVAAPRDSAGGGCDAPRPGGVGASTGPAPAQPTRAPLAQGRVAPPGQGGLHRAKAPGHAGTRGGGPSLPGFPPGPLVLFSLELCRAALPHTARPSETKGPARLTSPHMRTLRSDLAPSLGGTRTSRARAPGHGRVDGGPHSAPRGGQLSLGAHSRRKELEGVRRGGAGRGLRSPRPLGAAWPRGQDGRRGGHLPVTAAPAGVLRPRILNAGHCGEGACAENCNHAACDLSTYTQGPGADV